MGEAGGDRDRLASEKLQKIMECEENGRKKMGYFLCCCGLYISSFESFTKETG